jgi:hypothetical protein
MAKHIVLDANILIRAVWTEDTDFFGCGVAVWTSDRITLFLEDT